LGENRDVEFLFDEVGMACQSSPAKTPVADKTPPEKDDW
jgi:hypothetical protein